MQLVDPLCAVHPLRLELDEAAILDILRRVHEDDTTLTLEECDAALDWLYDYVVAQTQTQPGTTVLQ